MDENIILNQPLDPATGSNQTNGSQKTQVTDGVSDLEVSVEGKSAPNGVTIFGEDRAGGSGVHRINVDNLGNLTIPILTDGTQKTQIIETVPTDSTHTNPSETITETYVAPELTTVIQKVIGATTYTKTIVENFTTGVTTETAWS